MFNNINLITESLTKSSLKGPSPKVVQWLAAIFASLLLYIYREPIFTLLSLVRDKEGLIAYLEQFGGWAPALLSIVIMLQVVVAAIPGFLLMIVGGYIYGFSGGSLISYATTVITSMATFYAARAFGRKITNRFANTRAIKKWENVAAEHGFKFFVITMTIPLFPTDVIPYLAGLGKISSKRFAIANLLGRLPVSIVMTLIGSHNLELSPSVLIVVALFTLTMFVILYYLGKKAEQREENEANLGN